MKTRWLEPQVLDRVDHSPAVALLGPRQAGKTTLALNIADTRPSIYLDLESPTDRDKLIDAEYFLRAQADKLVVLDEVQRMPELFASLRGLIDEGRRKGKRSGQFLLLGSASADLLRQSESLAGRIAYLELGPLNILEVGPDEMIPLWVRGGFPESFLAPSGRRSLTWRDDFVRTYLERDIPQISPRTPSETLRRLWTMLGNNQGSIFNAAPLATSLALDGKTVARYVDLLVDLMLVRRLQPYQTNGGKRLVKSPKVYLRDSGVLHSLLHIGTHDALLNHPMCGFSWEGFVIENLIAIAPRRGEAMFYRTSAGAEIDLLFQFPDQGLWAIEIKLGVTSRPRKGFHIACNDLQPARRFVVNSGDERYPIGEGVECIGLRQMAALLTAV